MATPRFPCTECGSTNFEEIDAIWYCDRGHVQEGGQQLGEDEADYGKRGKASRQKLSKEKQKVLKVYRGVRGFRLYLKAWQHVLWKQCHALIHRHGYPDELWAVVRELWAVRLAKLAPRLEDTDDDLLKPTLELSTTSASESDIEPDQNDDKHFKSSHKPTDIPSLADTISLNCVGIILLQWPLDLFSIYRYIRQETICYIRAIRYVPQEMKERLAPEYHVALDTTIIPHQHDLQLAVYRTVMMYSHALDMVIPPCNWIVMLYGRIRRLALPLEVFPTVKYLANIVRYNFTYPQQQNSRRNATTYPEAQLTALVVVATKLLFPFDLHAANCYTQSPREPAALKMDWKAWIEAKREAAAANEHSHNLTPEKAIEVTDRDILEMTEDQLDQYMDWFQRTYSKNVKVDQPQKQILDMFPLHDLRPAGEAEQSNMGNEHERVMRLKHTQSKLNSRSTEPAGNETKNTDDTVRPGQFYQRYLSPEAMTETALAFHQEAASLACLSVPALLRACLRTERLLLLQQHELRRAEHFDEEEQMEAA